MTVVVTGSAGFVGGHLVERLAGLGYGVVGIDRRRGTPPAAAEIVADLAAARLEPAAGDALAGADAVFHLAGAPGVRASGAGIERRRWLDNVVAGDRVLRLAPGDAPVVVTSSSSVYGGATGGRASRESDFLRPLGGYARSKIELERRCAARARRGGRVAIARPFTVAGERQRPDMAVARWIEAATAGRPVVVLGGLGRSRDVTDVGDVVAGLVRLAERGVVATVNLGSGVARTLGELVAAVATAVGRELDVVVAPAGPAEPDATLADASRMRSLLGIEPATDLGELVRRQAGAGARLAASGAG